jgi:hypothetical protein
VKSQKRHHYDTVNDEDVSFINSDTPMDQLYEQALPADAESARKSAINIFVF